MSNTSALSPSRRWQARAAKSALKRAHEIYDVEAARKELASIGDPVLRAEKATESRKAAEMEMQKIAEKLTAYIPLDLSLGNSNRTRIEQFALNNDSFERISSNERRLKFSKESDNVKASLYNLKWPKNSSSGVIDYLDPFRGGDASSEQPILEGKDRTIDTDKEGDQQQDLIK